STNAWVGGSTVGLAGGNFEAPTATAISGVPTPGAGGTDGFIVKMSTAGTSLVFGRLANGDETNGDGTGAVPPASAVSSVNGVAVDGLGQAYITGSASSTTAQVAGQIQGAIIRRVKQNGSYLLTFNGAGPNQQTVVGGGLAVQATGDIITGSVGPGTSVASINVTAPGSGYAAGTI